MSDLLNKDGRESSADPTRSFDAEIYVQKDVEQPDDGGLTDKQIAARKRLHEQTLIYIEQDKARKARNVKYIDRGRESQEGVFAEGDETSKSPAIVYNPEDAPEGPPWRYDLSADQLEEKVAKKAKRVAKQQKIKTKALDKAPDKLKNPSDLQVRFRTALVYTLLTIVCVLAGDIPLLVYLMVVAGICAGEFFYMLRSDAKLPNEALGITGAVLYIPCTYIWGLTGAMIVSIVLLLALLVWYVFWLKARVQDVGVSFFGAAYTGLLLCGLVLIRLGIPGIWGGVALFLVFLSVWTNDAFAYFFGSHFGKHKMAPRTSPKKSWEGMIAGLIGSAIVWVILSFIPGIELSIPFAILFGIICGLTEVLGDLAESRIKRNSGFKDSGTIMPGHGGLLDRCDSLFLASVSSALLLLLGGCIPYVFA